MIENIKTEFCISKCNCNVFTSLIMTERKVYLVGGGIGSMAAAFFLIKDAGFSGKDIVMLEDLDIEGGSMDGSGNP